MVTDSNIQNIKIELIDEPREAMRTGMDREAIDTLAESSRMDGLINPITIRPVGDRYEVVAGHRRLLACRVAPLYTIPCVVRDLTEEQVFNVMSAENLAREDVNAVDQAIHIARLVGDDPTRIPEIAKRLHYSEAWVQSRLDLLEYPDYMLEHIATGALKLGVAEWLAKIESDFWRQQYVTQAVKHGMSVIQARYLCDQSAMGLCPDPGDVPPPSETYNGGRSHLATAICAQCGTLATDPNLTLVYVHKSCGESNHIDQETSGG